MKRFFPGYSTKRPSQVAQESACQGKRHGFNPWLGKIPWKGNGNPLQFYCLGNSMDRGAWRAAVHGIAEELDTT